MPRPISATLFAALAIFLGPDLSRAASVVGPTFSSDSFYSGTHFHSHFARGHYWVAYHDGTRPVLASTSDGVTWTPRGALFSFNPSPSMWAVRFRGNDIIAFAYNIGAPFGHYYTHGILNDDGSVFWSTLEALTGDDAQNPSVNALIANGRPVLWRAETTQTGRLRIGDRLDAPIVWTEAPDPPGPMTGISGGSIFQTGGPNPNDLIVIRANSFQHVVSIKYDAALNAFDSTWYNVSTLNGGLPSDATTRVRPGNDAEVNRRIAAVRDTSGRIHVVYVNENQDMVHYRKAAGFNDSWVQLSAGINPAIQDIDAVALTAAANNNLYLFYSKVGDERIYRRRFDGVGWLPAEVESKSNTETQNQAIGSMESTGGGEVGVAWNEKMGAPFDVMFSLDIGSCPGLFTLAGTGTFTVTAPSSFEMVFNKSTGGGIERFLDLAQDPGRDLAGGTDLTEALFTDRIRAGNVWYNTDQNATVPDRVGAKLDLLEATPTRVRVRQEAFYQEEGFTTILAGLKGIGDYSIYPSGRMALRWNQRATSSVAYQVHHLALVTNLAATPSLGWFWYSETDDIPANSGFDAFLLLKSDEAGAQTDFLKIISRDWLNPPYLADVDDTDEIVRVPESAHLAFWSERHGATIPPTVPPATGEIWDFLTYFKPTNFIDHTDNNVKSRARDYRSPDPLTIVIGTGWNENPADPDFFNESEAAYTLDFDPVLGGLTFSISGTATDPRYHPFFKIRQWRSLQDPQTVTVGGLSQVNDADFKADVKPISRGHFAAEVKWHSTFEDDLAVTGPPGPDIGPPGWMNGLPSYEPGRYGKAIRLDDFNNYVTFPAATFDYAQGAVEFWYRPNYDHLDGVSHPLFRVDLLEWPGCGPALGDFTLWKNGANELQLRIFTPNCGSNQVTVLPANYSWRANEWVHIRATWNEGAALTGEKLRLFVNGVEPLHVDPSALWPAISVVYDPRIGSDEFGLTGAGAFDEFYLYSNSLHPWLLANAGLTTSPAEYLADPGRNFTLSFSPVNGDRQGVYVHFGSDSKFRGLNVVLMAPGVAGVPPPDLRWEYWNGAAWMSLEMAGFTDQTNQLTKNGTIFWPSDPVGWSPYSVNGGPDLYYVRAFLGSGVYDFPPVEKVIKTDILLFQYCGDITTGPETFVFGTPVPTAVELLSLEARAGDGAIEITWETAAEVENLGFYLYRGISKQGAFERITSSLVPGLGSSPLGARYRYLDSGLANGQTYYYLLEDIEATGKRTKHGPVSATPLPGASLPNAPSASSPGSSAGIVYGKPEETSFRVLTSDRAGMALELLTGGFHAEPRADGTVRISVPGFVDEQAAIPVKRVWLESVVGKKVRITSVEVEDVAEFSSLRPSGAEIPEVIATRGVVRAGSRRAGEGRGQDRYPEWARVVSVVFQGETKKALLELSPMRWDGTRLSLARRLKVRVVFAGREAGEESLGGSRGRRHRELSSHRGARAAARLSVRKPGLYAVSFEEALGPRSRAVPAAKLRLSRQGKPVAYHLERGRFGPGSALYFVSKGASLNPYGEAAVYELSLGEESVRMPEEEGRPWGAPAGWYWQRLEAEENRIYQPALLEAEEPWFWDTLLSPVTKSYPFSVTGLASAGEPAHLELWLQGASDFAGSPDHQVRVYVNGALAAEETWDGKKPLNLEAQLGPGILREGENQISLENVGNTQAVRSMVMLERFAVIYPRLSVAEAGVLQGRWSESGAATVQGLAGRASVVDVTEEPPRWLTGVEMVEGGVRFGAEAGRNYLVVGAEAVLKPEVVRPAPSALKSERNVAEYLVLGPSELLLSAGPLLELRRSQGLGAKAVAIEEVYSEFGYGEERPEAIRDFLTYAYHHWAKPSPRYVLLLGDATYDFKDYLKTGVKNQVPPFLLKTSYWLTAADPTYGSVNGEDVLPDLAIGRLPARNAEEARALVEKIVAYETGPASLSEGRAVLVVDNPDRGGDFEADAEEVAGLLGGRSVQTIRVRELGRSGTRAAIVEAFDRGPSLMSYLGHGAILVWASENVFNNLDVRSLSPQEQQPFLLTMNCLNGYFHFPYLNSLAEELLKAEGRGVIAAFSPSGLSRNEPAQRYHKAVLSELLSGRRKRLGDVVLAAQAAFAEEGDFLELLSIYHLLGDPALRLR